MSACPHEYHEREASVYADGLCPICMRAEIERLRRELNLLRELHHSAEKEVNELRSVLEPFARNVDATSLSEALGHIEREHLREARRTLEGK